MLPSIPIPKPLVAVASAALLLLLSTPISPVAATAATAATGFSAAKGTIRLTIPASAQIPNPAALPPSTHATLTSLGASLSAPITTDSGFVFRDVAPGSYLADVHCATHGFAPLRVDVVPAVLASADQSNGGAGGRGREDEVQVTVWETFRGNDWDNKGERVLPVVVGGAQQGGVAASFPVKVLGAKVFYTERPGFSILSILKNPMILMGLVSLALFIGMPKLLENMDPEMRAEFEEQSRKNPMNSMLAGPQAGSNPMGNFDMAGFLAGQSSGSGNRDEQTSEQQPSPSGNGNGNGGKKGNRR
ncbi:hypothetical protein F5Y17DRAFT_421311 [Xylariaceae sp. FL0594]|nr:hypothetical protein F5Y17DRAFT_421311 [Xylariaceae sp. FL0594]